MLRDGMHQTAVHRGVAPYRPNSLDGGCPFLAGEDTGAYIEVPVEVPAAYKVRDAAASFDDHFSQARLFWLSMSPLSANTSSPPTPSSSASAGRRPSRNGH